MSENKFIRHLQGKDTAKSVLEIKNQNTPTSFADMPNGTSNANDVYSDPRGDAVGVLKGSDNWKLDGQNLVEATTVYGDGRDLTTTYQASGATLWVNSTYTFSSAKRFNPNTKFVLKLCGHSLDSDVDAVVSFSLIITFGNTVITKTFQESIYAFNFCKEFIIDFTESNANAIKAAVNSTMRVQLLCGDATASATIYNGMTVFTALQRRVDADAVSTDTRSVEEMEIDLDGKVNIDGSSIMTGPLKMRATSSFQCAIAPYWDGVGFYKLNSDDSVTLIASIDATDGFLPWTTNTYNIGSSSKKWKNLYLAGKLYVATINAGSDITVPNSTGEMLVNSATNSTSISIYGTPASGINTINIGRYTTPAGVNSIMIGNYSKAGEGAMAFGNGAEAARYGFAYLGKAAASYAYQIGRGTNSESYTLYVGWGTNENYKMLDGTTGFIPDARISSNIARMSDVELAARSGRMITDQGVWYAKMYAATVAPAAEDGTNYADFSQVDGQGNPVIITYNRVNGAWVQDQTITPPAEYDGYVPITSKIWDITEQAGQQGGRILWNHQSKEFTPYPQIISFEDINVTGNSTVDMPQNPSANQIVNKDYVDNHIPTGNFYHPDLFDWKWADHQLNDVQWLRGDTFSWQSGAVYEAAYQHLADDIDGKTLQSETIGATTIHFYLADDGHKICPASEESNVAAIYTATGVAWYYIIDTINERFKLPRTKWGMTGYRDGVGNYVNQNVVLPKIAGVFSGGKTKTTYTGPFYLDSTEGSAYPTGTNSVGNVVGFDTSRLNSVYSGDGTDTLIQPRGTQMYLYFYVGEFTHTAIENTAGLNAELFNGKADVSTVAHVVIEFQAPTASNNYTWYRKYADGWVEQGGKTTQTATSSVDATITLPIEMQDTEYIVTFSVCSSVANDGAESSVLAQTATTIRLHADSMASASGTKGFMWEVKGMAA